MRKVRWGLLSTANINKAVIPPIKASHRGELAAVASRDLAKAQAYAAQWGIPHAFGSYQQMLDSGLVDAIYIGLPNHLHAEWTVKALQAGVHVLCEKPFALSLAEVDRMVETSQKTGRILAEAFMYRHHPQTKIAGEWAHTGRLGEIRLVRANFYFAIRSRDNIRLAPEMGGGCLWDVGVYPLSFAQFIFGAAPQSVSGAQWLGESGVDEFFAGQMSYPGGRFAQISSSFQLPYFTRAEVIGSEGRLELTAPFTRLEEGRRMTFYPKNGAPHEIPVPEQELYQGEIEDMHAAILDAAPNYLSLAETRQHVRTVLALYESAHTGQVVELT